MIGQLHEHPLAELIRELALEGSSGALRLSRDRARAVVYFDGGDVVYAVSNIRAYRLAECVRRWGVLTEQQLAAAQNKGSDLEFGSALVEAGTLNQESFDALLAHQVSEMLCHALLWTEGEWAFDPRVRIPVDVRSKIKPSELMIESARRLPAEFVMSRFGDGEGKVSPAGSPTTALNLLPTEGFMLTRVTAPVSVNELVAISGLPEAETLRAIYTLFLSGLLSIEDWPQAFSAEALRDLKAAPPKRATGELKPEVKVQEAAKAAAPVEKVVDEKADLEAMFARLDIATNQYQVLGVVRPASDADIKRAYHSLAKRFHPDRFRKAEEEGLHARVEAAFTRIAQAYETLKDSRARAAYDSKLLKQGESVSISNPPLASNQNGGGVSSNASATQPDSSSPVNPSPGAVNESYQAEERFKQGLAALHDGNTTLAIACLSEAARLDPSQPRYRAYYGRALSGDERLRRSAEAELKAAVALDERNASYRVMLAEFYRAVGLSRRAQGELERALLTDPQNVTARRLLDKLKNGG